MFLTSLKTKVFKRNTFSRKRAFVVSLKTFFIKVFNNFKTLFKVFFKVHLSLKTFPLRHIK